MDTQRLLQQLLDLAEKLDVEVRPVPLGGQGGGLCVLRGKRVLFVDTMASEEDRLARTAAALAQLEDLENHYLLPQVRQVLTEYRSEQ